MGRELTIDGMLERSASDLPVVRVVVAATEGSAPRETGTWMIVDRSGVIGTIGGGQLEFEAIAEAQKMLQGAEVHLAAWQRELRTYPLGPKLAQCCGGMVRLLFELFTQHEVEALRKRREKVPADSAASAGLLVRSTVTGPVMEWFGSRKSARNHPLPVAGPISQMLSGERTAEPLLVGKPGSGETYFIEPVSQPKTPLFVYGAGHVGRAIVKIAADLPFEINWVDTHEHRFPDRLPEGVMRIVARDPAIIASAVPAGAFHLVLTYSHALDLAICHALLDKASFGFLGLIGSATKRARFIKRLKEGGISDDAVSRLTCPIGIAGVNGKAPTTIAISVAAQLVQRLEELNATQRQDQGGGLEPGKQLSA